MQFKRYILMLLLFANMTSEYRLLAPVSEIIFYSVLALSIPIILSNNIFSPLKIKQFPELFIIIIAYLIAQFGFQLDLLTTRNVLYTITKVLIFSIIILNIGEDFDFYFQKIIKVFPYLILMLIAIGWVYNRSDFYGNITFGFVNRNVACTIATAAFAGFIFKKDKFSKLEICYMLFLFVTILYGGSRNALAMCIIITLLRYGISFKIIQVALVIALLTFVVLPQMGVEATALDRLIGTVEGRVSIDREIERDIAIEMIKARPIAGWGYSYENISGIAMNAHNGYLTMIENLGWPCGGTVLLCIIIGCIKRLRLYFKKDEYVNFYIAIILATLFGANQEDYLIGVNQFTTNFFFVSFAILGMYRYNLKHGISNP